MDETGVLVGDGDFAAQVTQVFTNLRVALAAAGADLAHLVKWNILVVDGSPIEPAYEVFGEAWAARPNPPLITVAKVAGLALPSALVELEAVAVVP